MLGFTSSSFADGTLPIAESFAILQITGSPGRLGLILACQGGSSLLLSAMAGVVGDRFPRGRVMIISTVTRMLVAGFLAAAIATATASFALLLVAAIVYGCADAFFVPASRALLPEIVLPERLASANALIGGISNLGWIIAPAVAGILIGSYGPACGFALESAALAVSIIGLLAAKLPKSRIDDVGDSHPIRQLRSGWKAFAGTTWLWPLTLQWTVYSLMILAPIAVIGPTIARESLGGARAWGIITACLAIGVIVGQIFGGRLRPFRPALTAARLVPIMVVEALALGLSAPIAVISAAAATTGVAMGMQEVIFQTAMQRNIPTEILARVSSIDLLGSEIGQPAGYVLAGSIGIAVGVHSFLITSAVAVCLATAAFTLIRPVRQMRWLSVSAVSNKINYDTQ